MCFEILHILTVTGKIWGIGGHPHPSGIGIDLISQNGWDPDPLTIYTGDS